MTSETPENTTPPTSRRGGYLPVLPDGWVYNINIIRTEAEDNIIVQPEHDNNGDPTGRSLVHVYSSAGRKSLRSRNLGEGIRVAVDSAKILDRLARSEAEFKAARAAAMDSIVGDDEGADEPHVVEPVEAGDLAKDPTPETDDEREAANGNGIEDER